MEGKPAFNQQGSDSVEIPCIRPFIDLCFMRPIHNADHIVICPLYTAQDSPQLLDRCSIFGVSTHNFSVLKADDYVANSEVEDDLIRGQVVAPLRIFREESHLAPQSFCPDYPHLDA